MVKRLFDIVFSFTGIVLLSWLLLLFWVVAAVDTCSNGFFFQKRVGQYGKLFTIYKLRTMRNGEISVVGAFLRNMKIDELPQLFNVLKGDMSIVGPRPDLEGYYDVLQGEERKVLDLRPGLTSEASIKYFNEEALLKLQPNPLQYNDEVLFPDKVKMNLEYYYKKSFWLDLKIIFRTIFKNT
ncbi:sugar transferase [Flavobacterium enshiense]|uniref:sugar transferase n=1 Tax=Flavobacterium enshiense TaxID=1341165 RepID=UPI00345DCB5F